MKSEGSLSSWFKIVRAIFGLRSFSDKPLTYENCCSQQNGGITLIPRRSSRYPVADLDYADDIALFEESVEMANTMKLLVL